MLRMVLRNSILFGLNRCWCWCLVGGGWLGGVCGCVFLIGCFGWMVCSIMVLEV